MTGRSRGLPALLTGVALGATAAGGTALLLYTGQGFLRAAGLLVSSAIMAVAAGIWAGAPEAQPGPHTPRATARLRWTIFVVTLFAGGVFAIVWTASEPMRSMSAGGAVAVLLVLAAPAYAAGSLIAALSDGPRRGAGAGGVAAGALAGAAIGVIIATGMLMQTLPASGIYFAAAGMIAIVGVFDRAPDPATAGSGMDMTGHITLITGVGSRGQLGFAVARDFAGAGATVTISSRGTDIEEIAADLSGSGGDVTGVRADLLDDRDVERLIAGVRERHGRLDSLINVAGGLTVTGSVESTTPQQWHDEIERNAGTTLRMCRGALPLLRESGGAIVNFTSPAAVSAPAGLAAYSAAKAAVVAITRSLAVEEKKSGVRANAIAPGLMDTLQNQEQTGVRDGSRPSVPRDDVANVVLFLAHPMSRGVTGHTLHVLGDTIS